MSSVDSEKTWILALLGAVLSDGRLGLWMSGDKCSDPRRFRFQVFRVRALGCCQWPRAICSQVMKPCPLLLIWSDLSCVPADVCGPHSGFVPGARSNFSMLVLGTAVVWSLERGAVYSETVRERAWGRPSVTLLLRQSFFFVIALSLESKSQNEWNVFFAGAFYAIPDKHRSHPKPVVWDSLKNKWFLFSSNPKSRYDFMSSDGKMKGFMLNSPPRSWKWCRSRQSAGGRCSQREAFGRLPQWLAV